MKLADFGLSVIADASATSTSAHGGALRWLAPEIFDPDSFNLRSSRPTYASDVYSFATTVIEVRSSNLPYQTLLQLIGLPVSALHVRSAIRHILHRRRHHAPRRPGETTRTASVPRRRPHVGRAVVSTPARMGSGASRSDSVRPDPGRTEESLVCTSTRPRRALFRITAQSMMESFNSWR